VASETSRSASFVRIEVRSADRAAAEWAAAEAFAAGASGLEEREEEDGIRLLVYAPAACAARVREAAVRCGAGVAVSAAEPVAEEDWAETWKRGLGPVEVSPRLVVRPSFAPAGPPVPGRAELVIDPGQAFGTGGHESTRLALEWVDALAPALPAGARALDVGCGTGVLALAALRLGAARAVAIDLDRAAARAAWENAARNDLASRCAVACATPAALAPARFELVLANLLRTELLPLLPDLAARIAPSGRAVLSGLVAGEREAVERALAACGLRSLGERDRDDAGGTRWIALLTAR
jgi:ribosomal protein L11 methyltransferase